MNLESIRSFAVETAHRAGEAVLQLYTQPLRRTQKSNRFDFVTEGDKAAESIIISAIRSTYPEHRIVSEEGDGADAGQVGGYTWHIDPIDGTTNYAHQLPFFCISMGLVDSEMNPVVGVVHAPALGETFSAVRGGGATLNGAPLRVSQIAEIEDAVFSTGFPYDRASNPANNVDSYIYALMRSSATRVYGAAALEMCYVAAGRLDGCWECTLKSWDYTAGMLIVAEAGGMVTDFDGGRSGMLRGQTITSNGLLHDTLRKIVAAGHQN